MKQRGLHLLAVAVSTMLIWFLVGILRVRGPSIIVPVAFNNAARVPTHQQWCPIPTTPFPRTTTFPINFWYVKTFKTGSTTLSSVFNNLCAHYGIVWLRWDAMKAVAQLPEGSQATALGMRQAVGSVNTATDIKYTAITSHIPYSDGAAAQFQQPLMRFTSVRHPVARVHSHFIQSLCHSTAQQMGWTPGSPADGTGPPGPSACDNGDDATYLKMALMNDTIDNRWKFAHKEGQSNLMFWYIKGSKTTVQAAADQYDFIFVSERMNEGLVVFMLEYGLTYEDIAYLPSKIRTGRYKTAKDMPKDLNDYILSINRKDLFLWQLANKRLDKKKAQLGAECGADIVAAALRKFEQLLQEVSAECSDYIEWYKSHGYSAPYTYTGIPGLGDESGLGFRCVRHVARRFMTGADSKAQKPAVKAII